MAFSPAAFPSSHSLVVREGPSLDQQCQLPLWTFEKGGFSHPTSLAESEAPVGAVQVVPRRPGD